MERGTLLIADISGYTAYVAGVELDHALDILAALLGSVSEALGRGWSVAEVEGDAIFAYTLSPDPALPDTIDACYAAFARQRAHIQRSSTCTCRACGAVPALDLKVVVHASEFARQEIAGKEKLVGAGIILVHRLLKNGIPERFGSHGYAFYSEDAVAMNSIDVRELAGTRHEERYDVGPVCGVVVDLAAAWRQRVDETSIRVTEDDQRWAFRIDTSLSRADVWEFATHPGRLQLWMAERVGVMTPGALGVGAKLHCVHGRSSFVNEFVDWKPYRYFTWRISARGMPMIGTISLEEQPGGGTALTYRVAPDGARARRMARAMGWMAARWMAGARTKLERALREAEGVPHATA